MLTFWKKPSFWLAAAAGLSLFLPTAAHAQLEFTFSVPSQTAPPGSSVNYQAILTNTGDDTITFNGFNPGLTASGLTITDLFFINVPETLAPNTTGTYDIFGIATDPDAVPGVYNGIADIDYDTTTATGQHATQVYSLTIPVVVPEASSGLCFLLGFTALSLLALAKKANNRQLILCRATLQNRSLSSRTGR